MEESKQLSVTLLNDSLYRTTSAMVVGEHVQPASSSLSHKSTLVCYGDISIDYSQYYKEAPITFEDLLSDEESSVSSGSCGYEDDSRVAKVKHRMIVQQENSACSQEEGSRLR